MNGASRDAKTQLRRSVRLRRAERDPQAAANADQRRTQLVLDQVADLVTRDSAVVAAYWSALGEPATHQLVTSLREASHRVLLPVVSTGADRPRWAWFTERDDLVTASMGLLEPAGELAPQSALRDADLVICPGLLGGRDGSRLGTGGGWYDRALAAVAPHTPRWLLLFADEVRDAVPTEPHDLGVTDLVSEAGWVHCRPGSAR